MHAYIIPVLWFPKWELKVQYSCWNVTEKSLVKSVPAQIKKTVWVESQPITDS